MNKPVNANQEFQSDFLSVTEARTAISAVIHSIQAQARLHEATESLPLKECLGRILASDVVMSWYVMVIFCYVEVNHIIHMYWYVLWRYSMCCGDVLVCVEVKCKLI